MVRFVGPEAVCAGRHADASEQTDDVGHDPQGVAIGAREKGMQSVCEQKVHQDEEDYISPHDPILGCVDKDVTRLVTGQRARFKVLHSKPATFPADPLLLV